MNSFEWIKSDVAEFDGGIIQYKIVQTSWNYFLVYFQILFWPLTSPLTVDYFSPIQFIKKGFISFSAELRRKNG